MRFYIVDDDENMILILKNIIKKQNLGSVIGFSYDGKTAYDEILEDTPDIVLIDYLMPKLDGASLVKSLVEKNINSRFIMISQVNDSSMVSDVYKDGIEFFIHKPINIVEVERVIKSVSEKVNLMKKFDMLRGIVNQHPINESEKQNTDHNIKIEYIKRILSEIGILGEKGSDDIIRICMLKLEKEKSHPSLNDLCLSIGPNVKVIKQRIRRTIAIGLRNISYLGIEDNLNEYFLKYSNTLFDFESIRFEMEFLRGKSKLGGRINLDKFIENLILQSNIN